VFILGVCGAIFAHERISTAAAANVEASLALDAKGLNIG
jgi:hypothetical protein